MRRLHLLLLKLFRRDRFERETREELDAYVELFIDSVLQDIRYAIRLMRRQPGFTLVAILTLALGIGANTAVMSVVRSVLLAPLPFEDADRLVRLRIIQTDASGRERDLSLVPAYFHGIRERSRLLERVAAQRLHNLTLTESDRADRVVAIGVSDQWVETLGIRPLLGRPFSEKEQREGSAARVVLLGHGFWLRQFGGDQGILGRSIRLNDRSHDVIGVMPPQFRYPYEADLWFPISIPPAALSPSDLNVPARMRPGVTHAQLEAELSSLTADLTREFPSSSRIRLAGIPMREEFARDPNRSIAALSVAAGFVLLLACVNLATLLTARGGTRAREFALRTAIGADRRRQIRQLLTESALLAAAGGVGGVAMAFGLSRWLGGLIPARLSEVIQRVEIDGTVLAASAILCAFTGLLFGIVPALRLTRQTPAGVLKDGGRPGAASGGRLLDLLVVGEAAVAMVLLTGAAVMAQNFERLLTADVGYDATGLIRINLSLTDASYADPRRRTSTIRQILERIEAVPGIASAGVTSLQPIPRTRANLGMSIEPDSTIEPTSPLPLINRRLVTPAYFKTMGLRLVTGRGFTELDGETSQPVAVLNEAAARRFWPGADPIGRHVRPGPRGSEGPWHIVVGVVSNVAEPDDAGMRETIYQPYAQANATLPPGVWVTTSASVMVRTTGDSAAAIEGSRGAIRAVDPSLPLFDIAGMETALAAPLSGHRLGATLFVVFGVFGLVTAVLGTYGVVAFSVSRRVPEFGVRLALGASPSELLRTVMIEGLRLATIGIVAGTLASLALSRLLGAIVTEVNPRDPRTLATVGAVLFVAAAAACFGPALRATRVDPIKALRLE